MNNARSCDLSNRHGVVRPCVGPPDAAVAGSRPYLPRSVGHPRPLFRPWRHPSPITKPSIGIDFRCGRGRAWRAWTAAAAATAKPKRTPRRRRASRPKVPCCQGECWSSLRRRARVPVPLALRVPRRRHSRCQLAAVSVRSRVAVTPQPPRW